MPVNPLAIFFALRSVPRWAWYALAAAALFISILIYLDHTRDEAVRQDRAERQAEVTKRTLRAERTASRNDEARRVVRERQTRELETARDEAIHEHPEESNLPAGPAVSGVLNELRQQQGGGDGPAR